jgi:mono/diheme cytochrome c family protein
MKILKVLVALVLPIVLFSAFTQKPSFDLKGSITRGKDVYESYCITCHMEKGEGIESVYPPVAKSDYLMADKKRSINVILKGLTGEIKVNGTTYNADMTSFDLTDQEASDVLNYIRNSFGNKGEAVRPEEVKALRNEHPQI